MHDAAVAERISWIPSWADPDALELVVAGGDGPSYSLQRPLLGAWRDVGAGLREARRALQATPIAEIVEAIDEVAAQWCERDWPVRRAACARAAAATGFSEEVVDRSFDVELRNYRADSLWRALRRELGDPAVLDGPRPDPVLGGLTTASSHGIVLAIFTGNVPGLPALSIVRALLTKSAFVAKVAAAEPTFAGEFVRTLAEADPRLGDAGLVTYWERDDVDTRAAVFALADVVIAYGGDESCAAARAATGPHQRFLEHGHRLSVGLVTRAFRAGEGDAAVARAIARDTSMFNQHACIAPQAYLVEGGHDDVARFCATIAHALDDHARECPLGDPPLEQAAALQLRRADAHYRAAASAGRRLWAGRDWAVALDDELDAAATGDRMLRVLPVDGPAAAVELLRPYGDRLQNVAVGATDAETPALVQALAGLGATRVCAPGAMAEPSLAWRHDGRMCIAELVRWCDVEMHPWTSPDREEQGWAATR
ncbi:MAG TPA: acyl-CoA reductase [Solirubrobacteraceae bacterium]|nr:acyl-CoA reductase [Solirubrobacteraceae bacterium]